MGIGSLWAFIREKGYVPQIIRGLPSTPPLPSSKFRVDLLASFYPQVRYHYLNDSSTFPQAIERHLISCELHKETSVLYLDGISPVEKQHTNSLRQYKRNNALAGVEDCIRDMEKSLEGGHAPHKPTFKNLEKKLRGAFYLGQDSRMVLATYLRGQGWNLPEVASESDVAIACDFKPGDVVVSGDSDMAAYENVETIYRPLSRKRFLKYKMAVVTKHLELSRKQLTALCCVSKNDYTTNLTQMGIKTNYGIMKTITDDGIVFISFSLL
jgi:hypothetical protein